MKYVILKKTKDNDYWPSVMSSSELDILAIFLMSDIGPNALKLKTELKEKEDVFGQYNITQIDIEDNYAELQDAYSSTENNPKFVTTRKKLIEVLEKWDELYKQKPNKIIIALDGENITLEVRN